jgi:hypothetical protein
MSFKECCGLMCLFNNWCSILLLVRLGGGAVSIAVNARSSTPEHGLQLHGDAAEQRSCLPHLLTGVLRGLQQLTYLELLGNHLQDPEDAEDPDVPPGGMDGQLDVQGPTKVQDLRLHRLCRYTIPASIFTGLLQLTRLKVEGHNGKNLF